MGSSPTRATMEKCFHKKCNEKAVSTIDTSNEYIEVCLNHFTLLIDASQHKGGYSSINTVNNIYGWRQHE